jgi:membrane fusion protein (multidrug efflux system)
MKLLNNRMFQMLAVVLVIVAALGFIKFRQIQAAIASGSSWAPPPEAVTTVIAKEQQWTGRLTAVGSVEPVQGVTLSADLPGVVERIAFESGRRVSEGQVLVQLDTRQERAQLASAQARLKLAETSLNRARQLIETQTIAQAEFDQIEAQYRQAEAGVQEIQATIDRKTIRAPFSGVTGIREVNVGEYVNSGAPIVPIMSSDPVHIDFAVPQQDLTSLKVGSTVHVGVENGAREVATGRVTAINPVVDEDTRNVQIQATCRNRSGELRPGMFVTVEVVLGAESSVIALPTTSINYAPYGNSVFIVEDIEGPDGNTYRGVRQQFVKLGTSRGDLVAVLDGVKPGQEVATAGVFKLRSGAAVTVDNSIQPGESQEPKPSDS